MAYSNGAEIGILYDERGSTFSATLDARNFVLLVSEVDLTTPMVARLKPKEHPDATKTMLFEDEVQNLLIYGHTFRPNDINIRWPLFSSDQYEPPAEIVDGQLDTQLRQCVLSDLNVLKLKENLRLPLRSYKRQWEAIIHPLQQGWLDIRWQTLQPKYFRLGIRILDCHNHTTRRLFATERRSSDGQNRSLYDILETTREQLKEIKKIKNWPDRGADLLKHHRQLVAYQSMFILSQHIPAELSTRNMGKSVLLA